MALDAAEAAAKISPEVNSQRLFTRGRSAEDASAPSEPQALNTLDTYLSYVSEDALVAAPPDTRNALEVNSQKLFTRECSEVDGRAPSEQRTQNS